MKLPGASGFHAEELGVADDDEGFSATLGGRERGFRWPRRPALLSG